MIETIDTADKIKASLVSIDTINELYKSGFITKRHRDKSIKVEKGILKTNVSYLKMDVAKLLE